MPLVKPDQIKDSYDVLIIGSGFGSLFFLHRFIQHQPQARILVLERGPFADRAWQLENQQNSPINPRDTAHIPEGEKVWNFNIGYGGGTNCWWGITPRLQPSDFKTQSLFGIGQDWPIDYETLIPYYQYAETLMNVSGEDAMASVYPGLGPLPLPPHRFSTPDEILKRAHPNRHFAVPTARASLPTSTRGQCCSTARCNLCPVDAKFNAHNGFPDLLDHPHLDLCLEARVDVIEKTGNTATGVMFVSDGIEYTAKGDLIVLGANAIHSPAIMMASGFDDYAIGRFLHEKFGYYAEVFLDGIDAFDGGVATTGFNTTLIDGSFRSEYGASVILTENRRLFGYRSEYGKWRQTLPVLIMTEDIPADKQHIKLGKDGLPVIDHSGASRYAKDGSEACFAQLPDILGALPIEQIIPRRSLGTFSHIQGTLRMGRDPDTSVVDEYQIHHSVRNLLVVGSSTFPSCGTGNPSLTLAAMSLRSADYLGRVS